MLTRRTATVIISAPDASCACTITVCEEYFPVPTISRDENGLSAIVNRSISSATDEVDDFDLIPFANRRAIQQVALDDDQVVLDRNAARVDVQPREEFGDRQGAGELVCIAVQRDAQFPMPILVRFV